MQTKNVGMIHSKYGYQWFNLILLTGRCNNKPQRSNEIIIFLHKPIGLVIQQSNSVLSGIPLPVDTQETAIHPGTMEPGQLGRQFVTTV